MKTKRSVEIKILGKNRIMGIYSSARLSGQSSEEVQSNVQDFLKSLPKDTPQWVGEYFSGVQDTMSEMLYRYDLEFCYVVDGTKYSVKKDSKMYYQKHNISPRDLYEKATKSGHYWIDTDKLWFSSFDSDKGENDA